MRLIQWHIALALTGVALLGGAHLPAQAQALAQAQAQTYPSRPIHLVVPVPPGGGSDIIARVLAERLTASMKQPVIVDNKPGAGAMIGSDLVAKAAPDGYTLLIINNAFVINPWLYKLPFDTLKDFAPITIVATSPNVLVAHPSVPASNVRELVALAKAKPGSVTVAVSQGQISQLGSALLEQAADIKLQLIPYKGSAAGSVDLLSGNVMLSFGTAPSYMAQIKAGKLKALGVGGASRLASLPDVPPISDTIPGFEANTWFGLFTTAGTPPAVIERLHREVMIALSAPAVTERMTSDGFFGGTGLSPQQFGDQVRREMGTWESVIRKAGIKAE